MQERVCAALRELQSGGHANVLVVTHAGPLHAMLHAFFGGMEVRFLPASVTRVAMEDGQPRLVALNDVAHLPVQ